MKRALDYKEYRDTKPFEAPDGIVTIDIDPLSGQPATPPAPVSRPEVFIAGTQPLESCRLAWRRPARRHSRHGMGDAAAATERRAEPSSLPQQPPISRATGDGNPALRPPTGRADRQPKEKKKGFFGRIFGIFK